MKISSCIHMVLLPFWRHLPLVVRRMLIWIPTPKFIVGIGVVCMNSKNQVLLLHHRFHNEYPWGLPTGWMHRNEHPQEAARRELKEETGIDVEIKSILSIESNRSWLEIIFLGISINDNVLLEDREIQGYAWVGYNELRNYKLAPKQEKVIMLLMNRYV